MVGVFTNAFIEVCEGQALDKEYEHRSKISMKEYLTMIKKKTAAMIAASCKLGALAGGGTMEAASRLFDFGRNLGIAFQIQDDLLDITGDEEEFGKRIGGDVMEGKKTFLLVKALQRASVRDQKILSKIQPSHEVTLISVSKVLAIYRRIGVLKDAHKEINRYTNLAHRELATLPSSEANVALRRLSEQLVFRTS